MNPVFLDSSPPINNQESLNEIVNLTISLGAKTEMLLF